MITGTFVPMSHQSEDVERLSAFTRVFILNGLGTGKTATACWWLHDLWKRGIIDECVLVLPSMCMSDWRSTFCGGAVPEGMVDFFDCRPPAYGDIFENVVSDFRPPGHALRVMATTYGGMRGLMRNYDWGSLLAHVRGRRIALVCDEAQSSALPGTAQGIACRSFANCCRSVAAVTATPIGRAENLRLWGLVSLVRPDLLDRHPPGIIKTKRRTYPVGPPRSFDAFKYRYAHLHDPMESPSRRFRVSRAFVVAVHHDLIQREVLDAIAPCTVRRAKDDCLDLPDKVYFRRDYHLPAAAARVLRDLLEDDRAVLDDGHAIVPPNVLIERLRTLELTGGWVEGRPLHDAKLRLLCDVLAEVGDALGTGVPLLVWASRSREVLACALVAAGIKPAGALQEASLVYPPGATAPSLGAYRQAVERAERAGVGIIHGSTSTKDRDRIQNEWRAGRIRTVVAHPGVAGAGLNWQHVRASIYYSPPLGTIARRQSEDRVHRHGLTHTALYYDLVSDDGPDGAVYDAHREQASAALAMLDWLKERIAESE